MNERDLKKQCRMWLKKIPNSKWVSYNPYPTGEPGTPDYIGCVNGHSVLIEFKCMGKEPSPIQLVRFKEWQQAGASVILVHSLEELKIKFKELKLCQVKN